MNTLKKALDVRGMTVLDASRMGVNYQTVRKHYLGERSVGAESALRYEDVLKIPRSELRPDLWPSMEGGTAPAGTSWLPPLV